MDEEYETIVLGTIKFLFEKPFIERELLDRLARGRLAVLHRVELAEGNAVRKDHVIAILDELRRVILEGTVAPGTPIPLAEVADLFGVSRIPVRESLKTLIGEGLVTHRSNFGYTVAQAMTQVLKQCGNDLSRENIMKQAANLKSVEFPLLLPGIKVTTSPTDHAPIEQEQLAKFDGERWALFGELYDAGKK